MSVEFFFRIIGMVVFAILGAYLGNYIANLTGQSGLTYSVLLGLVGALTGLIRSLPHARRVPLVRCWGAFRRKLCWRA